LQDLTPRELEILTLVARGMSNGEIADDLILSQATVKTHVKHVLRKLDLRDRVHAVVLAYEAGKARNPQRIRRATMTGDQPTADETEHLPRTPSPTCHAATGTSAERPLPRQPAWPRGRLLSRRARLGTSESWTRGINGKREPGPTAGSEADRLADRVLAFWGSARPDFGRPAPAGLRVRPEAATSRRRVGAAAFQRIASAQLVGVGIVALDELGPTPRVRGRKPVDKRDQEIAELRRRAERAEAELQKAKKVIEIQGKCAARRSVVFPVQPERTRRRFLGPMALPGSER